MENETHAGVTGAMRADLLGIRGMMYSVSLPAKREGKYRFAATNGKNCSVPVSIVVENGAWVLKAGKGVRLYKDETDIGEQIPLDSEYLIGVTYGDQRYIVYTEEEKEQEAKFVHYTLPEMCDITIGRDSGNTIVYENHYVSRNHARLLHKDGVLYIRDEDSTNGTYLNGTYIREAAVMPGDVIYILGLRVIIGAGFISINKTGGTVWISNDQISVVSSELDVDYAPIKTDDEEEGLFDRLPRRKSKLEEKKIEISGPPSSSGAGKMPLMLRVGNTMMTGSRALMSGNVTMALSSMLMPMVNQGYSEKEKKEYDEKRLILYREYLTKKEEELYNERDFEEKTLNEIYPPLEAVVDITGDPARLERLWERRYVDEDFLDLRIGSGTIRMKAEIEYPKEDFELETDMLNEEMREVAGRDYSLRKAPVMLSLKQHFITGMVGTPMYTQRVCLNMILHLCFSHSYDETKIIILGDEADYSYIADEMAQLHYVPHFWDDLREFRFIGSNKAGACAIGEYLKKKIGERFEEKNIASLGKEKYNPSYVVFAFNKDLLDCIELTKDILSAKACPGISIITAFGTALKETTCLVKMTRKNGVMIDLAQNEDADIHFTTETYDKEKARAGLRYLMKTKLKTAGKSFTLPKTYTFLEMFGAGKVEYLNPLTRWKNSNPMKSLATEIGVGTDGEHFYLDLHQKRQGPHGLIAGTTGSGKSEFIITYILSLAVNYSPDEVAFVLIDYKGGGLATAFDDPKRDLHLPHVVGTITNLDGAAIQRSMTSINSELKRRQAVFNVAKSMNDEGTMDIYDYQKLYRAGKVPEPMPHLFLIADEFAELKKQEPEFMDALISTARIGRSLGVHLILATQKPTGVVNDQIWSNTKFRVCLKVQDANDSREMLKRPEAAELKDTGRFYLQVGHNEYFAMGQSAWCGADYLPQEEAVSQTDDSIDFLDATGQVTLNAKPKVNVTKTDKKQLVAIVQYLSDLAKEENILPKRLWMDPLPQLIEYEDAFNSFPHELDEHVTAFIGPADDPEKQRRMTYDIALNTFHHMLICGNAGSGKSTFLRTMLYSLVRQYSPEDLWYYILDLSGGAMNAMKSMPHCGAYLTENDERDFSRVIELLQNEVEERKKLFKEMDVSNFEAYRQVKKLPYILFIIDGYTNITNFESGTNFNLNIHQLMRELAPYGIHVIISINHMNEISAKGRQEVDYRVALQAKDKYDYGDILARKAGGVPTAMVGTGYCVIDDNAYEYHVAIPDTDLTEKDRSAAMKERLRKICESKGYATHAKPLPVVDETLTYQSLCDSMKPNRIPLGFNRDTAAEVAIPLKQLHNMGLYFGNPNGVKPVLANLLTAAKRDHMAVTVLTRNSGSLFSSRQEGELRAIFPDSIEYLNSSEEGIARFNELLQEEIAARNVFRDEYCATYEIPSTDKGRILKAAKYVFEKTTPRLFIFESVLDLCANSPDSDVSAAIEMLIERTKGYNIYFAGLYYPEDADKVGVYGISKALCKEQFLLLFGGRYDKITVTQVTNDMRKITHPHSDPTKYMMKYRDEFYRMHIPCDYAVEEQHDPDDESIV